MVKLNAKNLAIIIFLGVFLMGIISIVYAQQVLPQGGDSFETAVEIEAENYVTDHDISRKTLEYFKLPAVKAGQLLVVKATNLLTGVDIVSNAVLYDENRAMLVPGYDNPLDLYGVGEIGTYKWLPNSSQDSYLYYMAVGGGVNFIAEGTKYDISIEDKFDAGTQTDAGDTFEKAISITAGEHKGYLSGEMGTDTKDFYKLAVNKDTTLTVKVTPPSYAGVKVVIYDSNRAKLKEVRAPNQGAIVTSSVGITKTGDVFAAVFCDEYCSDSFILYTLNVTAEEGVIESTDEDVIDYGEWEEDFPFDTGDIPDIEGGIPDIEGGVLDIEGLDDVAKAVGKGITSIILFWIVGPIFFLVIIGIIIYFILKKKKE